MTSTFPWLNSISLCPASFCIPRPNLPVTPGVSWHPTFAFQSPIMKRISFWVLVLKGLVGLHRTVQFQLLQCYWLGHRLTEFCQENAMVTANTLFQKPKVRLYAWTSPDGQHWNQIDYILCSQRWRSYIQSAKTRPGADCGSDHELLIGKFRQIEESKENH